MLVAPLVALLSFVGPAPLHAPATHVSMAIGRPVPAAASSKYFQQQAKARVAAPPKVVAEQEFDWGAYNREQERAKKKKIVEVVDVQDVYASKLVAGNNMKELATKKPYVYPPSKPKVQAPRPACPPPPPAAPPSSSTCRTTSCRRSPARTHLRPACGPHLLRLGRTSCVSLDLA